MTEMSPSEALERYLRLEKAIGLFFDSPRKERFLSHAMDEIERENLSSGLGSAIIDELAILSRYGRNCRAIASLIRMENRLHALKGEEEKQNK